MIKLIRIALAVVSFFGVPKEIRADERIRHEFRPSLTDEAIAGVIPSPRSGESILVRDGRPAERTETEPAPRLARMHRASNAPRHRPDRATDFMGELAYFETYQPSVAPHKRLEAFDGVEIGADGVPELIVVSKTREQVAVGEAGGEGHRFIGELWVDFSESLSVPIPSVSPRMRILHLESAPAMSVRVERDGAGNYFLRAPSKFGVPVRVLLFVEADPGYFNQPIPDVPLKRLDLPVSALPPKLEAEALAFASELGLSRDHSLKEALDVLVEYFRAFIEGETQVEYGGSIYGSLARGGYGICRHRAYAFMITALALGIPTRYVQNEAHAFVEIDFRVGTLTQAQPVQSMRIELGGSTAFVEGHGLRPDSIYRPQNPDPFPQPAAYLEGMRRGSIPQESGESRTANGFGGVQNGLENAYTRSTYRATLERARLVGYRGDRLRVSFLITDSSGAPARNLPLMLGVTGTSLAHASSDERGFAQFSLRIPFDIEPGTHKLELLTRVDAGSPLERIPIAVE